MVQYTQTEAAELLGVTPKTARAWLSRVTPAERAYGHKAYLYTREQLLTVATAHGRGLTDETTVLTLDALAARVDRLERILGSLSGQPRSLAEPKPMILRPRIKPPESPYSASGDVFNKETALDWLQLHGDWSRSTPKTWEGWQTTPLDKAAILQLALQQDQKRTWRQTWTLHKCGDPGCICHEAIKG